MKILTSLQAVYSAKRLTDRLKGKPKDICIDRVIGTWKVSNVEGLNPNEAVVRKSEMNNLPLC